jgi:hypothetical protein
LNDFIHETKLNEQAQILQQQNQQDEDLIQHNLKSILMYTEGGYFGDSDIFAQSEGISTYIGRDSSAICQNDLSLFVLNKKELQKMRENFLEQFEELKINAIMKYKNH